MAMAVLGALLVSGCEDELRAGDRLNAGQSIYSEHGRHRLTMDSNGILNLYGPASIVWRSHGSNASGVYAKMQSNGDFVVRNGSTVFFRSDTAGNPGAYVKLDNHGRLMVLNATGQLLWMGAPVIAGYNTPAQNRTLAYSMIDEFFPQWSSAAQKECLNQLWQHESGWSHTALNPSSGACGIPQSLPCNKMANWGFFYLLDYTNQPYPQIMWGLNYIKDRPDYAHPCEAWQKWNERWPHWY